jgi:hypothetical protein
MILDHNIDLAGVGKNGLIHTHPGEVTISEILDLKSTTERVNITAIVQGDNVTMTVIEAWPTSLIDKIELSYSGKGISSWETYSNINDAVCSRFRATKLEKESRCNTTLIKTVVRAEITPENVTERKGFVTGTDYKLKSTSVTLLLLRLRWLRLWQNLKMRNLRSGYLVPGVNPKHKIGCVFLKTTRLHRFSREKRT